MAYPTSDWPGATDATLTRVNLVDIVDADDFNYQDAQVRGIQGWLGDGKGEIIGDNGVSADGVGGALSPIASGGNAFTIAAKANYTSGKLLRILNDYDGTPSEEASVDFEGKAVFAGVQLGATTAVVEILDEDNMSSDSATALATQQSIKAYVDAAVAVENLWNRAGTVLSPNTPGDTIEVGGIKLGATTAVTSILDEDDMVTDSATALATQQSIKAYVDTENFWSRSGIIISPKTSGDVIGLSSGTEANPAIAFIDDSYLTGIYRASANNFGISINSSLAAVFTKVANIPYMNMYRKDVPGDNVDLGHIVFVGRDDSTALSELARITGHMESDAAGSEAGAIILTTATSTAGALTEIARVNETGINLNLNGDATDPAISRSGDTDTGIFFPAAGEIGFTTNGSYFADFAKTSNIPYISLYRMDTHGSDVFTGGITFYGKDAVGTEAEYAQVLGYAESATGGSEVGSLKIKTATSASGALTTCAVISGEGTEFDPGTRHKQQAVTSSSNQVNVDCENGYVIYHELTENTTVQPPTNEIEPVELIFIVDGDGSSTLGFTAASTAGGFAKSAAIPSLSTTERLIIKFIYDNTKDFWAESSRIIAIIPGGGS